MNEKKERKKERKTETVQLFDPVNMKLHDTHEGILN